MKGRVVGQKVGSDSEKGGGGEVVVSLVVGFEK